MKILYLTKGDHVDYQDDCLFLGLRELFGSDIVDYNKREHNYTYFDSEKVKQYWGRGMTVSRILDDVEIDRTDLTQKIKNKYFDFIVYGSIWRCSDHLTKILEYYKPHQVIAVDGEDHTHLHNSFHKDIQYFKRELIYDNPKIYPISFAMPTAKINFNKVNKSKPFSFITPLDSQTYVYDNEQNYYNDYQSSYFGVTIKKAGWDCLRHYEILGNGCIPNFLYIEHCPKQTLVNFPKSLCYNVNQRIANDEQLNSIYESTIEQFEKAFYEHLTTKALAKYFINKITHATN
jgi:hypothetical protein